VKKRDDSRTRIEALLVRPQGTARYLEHLGRLTLGETLGLQIAILRIQLRTFDTLPTLGALIMATLRILDSCFHSSLLLKPLSWAQCMAKDGEGTLAVQPFTLLSC
jgi:hypothetical protein